MIFLLTFSLSTSMDIPFFFSEEDMKFINTTIYKEFKSLRNNCGVVTFTESECTFRDIFLELDARHFILRGKYEVEGKAINFHYKKRYREKDPISFSNYKRITRYICSLINRISFGYTPCVYFTMSSNAMYLDSENYKMKGIESKIEQEMVSYLHSDAKVLYYPIQLHNLFTNKETFKNDLEEKCIIVDHKKYSKIYLLDPTFKKNLFDKITEGIASYKNKKLKKLAEEYGKRDGIISDNIYILYIFAMLGDNDDDEFLRLCLSSEQKDIIRASLNLIIYKQNWKKFLGRIYKYSEEEDLEEIKDDCQEAMKQIPTLNAEYKTIFDTDLRLDKKITKIQCLFLKYFCENDIKITLEISTVINQIFFVMSNNLEKVLELLEDKDDENEFDENKEICVQGTIDYSERFCRTRISNLFKYLQIKYNKDNIFSCKEALTLNSNIEHLKVYEEIRRRLSASEYLISDELVFSYSSIAYLKQLIENE